MEARKTEGKAQLSKAKSYGPFQTKVFRHKKLFLAWQGGIWFWIPRWSIYENGTWSVVIGCIEIAWVQP